MESDGGGLRIEGFIRGAWRVGPLWLGPTVFFSLDAVRHQVDLDEESVVAADPRWRIGASLDLTFEVP